MTDLELGELYAFQVNYRTSTTTMFSARDAYVWPSSGYPENGERVGTYTFFGHHADKEFEYIICRDTFPAVQRNQWVELIKHAFGQWATSTDQFVTMIPRVHGVDGWHCSDTSLPIRQFIMEDWTLRNSSGVSEGVDKSVEQSDGEFLNIGVWGRQ